MPAPNRLAVYVVAAAALATAVAGVVADLDFSSVAAILGSLAVLGGVVAKWLVGWQQYEHVAMLDTAREREAERAIAVTEAQAEAAAKVGRPGSKPILPR